MEGYYIGNVKNELKEYTRNAKGHAENGIAVTYELGHNTKDRIFNMEIPLAMERALKNRLHLLAILSAIIGIILLIAMIHSPIYLLTAIIIGVIGAAIDFAVEHKGVTQNDWDYPVRFLSFRKIPLELPILFFNCGIIATFAHYAFSDPRTQILFDNMTPMGGISIVQIVLLITSIFFFTQYFRGKNKCFTFGALPIAIALYIAYPQSWILAISIIPIYVDYYLERYMVRTTHITYDPYGEVVASHVAVSYYPATIIILVLISIILNYT